MFMDVPLHAPLGLQEMPAATQDGLLNALNALRDDGRSELTLLVLGKGGVGKSRCAVHMLPPAS